MGLMEETNEQASATGSGGGPAPNWFKILVVVAAALALVGYFAFKPIDSALVHAYQRGSPDLDGFFGAITLFGDELVNVVLVVLTFYVANKETGARLAYVVVVANLVDVALKGFFGVPRPFAADPSVIQVPDLLGQTYEDYSFPSGHAVNAGAFWGFLALETSHPLALVAFCVMVVLVPLSRNYLGVHWPSDVVVGASLGAFVALVAWWSIPKLESFKSRLGNVAEAAVAASWPILAWVGTWALVAALGNDPSLADASSSAGLLVGLYAGLRLERTRVALPVAGRKAPAWVSLYRAVLGTALALGTYFGLKLAFGDAPFPTSSVLRFVRYAVLSAFATFVVPLIFKAIERGRWSP